MELPSPAPALAVALLVVFAARSPLPSLSSPLPLPTPTQVSSNSTSSPSPPPGRSFGPPSPRHRPPPSTVPGDGFRPPGPPVRCAGNSAPDCVEHLPPKGSSSGSFTDADRSTARRGRQLNLGKKVGVTFLAAFSVLQIVLGGFLIYKRWEIKKAGYERHVVS